MNAVQTICLKTEIPYFLRYAPWLLWLCISVAILQVSWQLAAIVSCIAGGYIYVVQRISNRLGCVMLRFGYNPRNAADTFWHIKQSSGWSVAAMREAQPILFYYGVRLRLFTDSHTVTLYLFACQANTSDWKALLRLIRFCHYATNSDTRRWWHVARTK